MQSLANYSRKFVLKQSGHQRRKPGLDWKRQSVSAAVKDKQPFLFILKILNDELIKDAEREQTSCEKKEERRKQKISVLE